MGILSKVNYIFVCSLSLFISFLLYFLSPFSAAAAAAPTQTSLSLSTPFSHFPSEKPQKRQHPPFPRTQFPSRRTKAGAFPLPEPDPETRSDPGECVRHSSHTHTPTHLKTLRFFFSSGRRRRRRRMYKNQLQELAQRSCFNLPSYTCIREGPDHAPRFKATVNFNGEVFESPHYCSTLRQAEHSAAEVALNSLSHRGPSHSLAARILVSSTTLSLSLSLTHFLSLSYWFLGFV